VWRPLMDRVYIKAQPFFTAKALAAEVPTTFTGLSKALPANVQVITLEAFDPEGPDVFMLRLAHQFGRGEDAELSKPAVVDLDSLFQNLEILQVEEMGLTGTISRSEVLKRRFAWKIDGEAPRTEVEAQKEKYGAMNGNSVTLGPLQIRTFKIIVMSRKGSIAVETKPVRLET
jgi:hypothetical protein